jgi:hypothetical protein
MTADVDVIGRFTRGDKLDTNASSVEVLLQRAQLAPSPMIDEQLLKAHTATQYDMQRARTCKLCRRTYVEHENVGRWRCAMHYLHWDTSCERWACCMMRTYSAYGCVRCDHTDTTRDVLEVTSVPSFLQSLVCRPAEKAFVDATHPDRARLRITALATDGFVTENEELYAQYAAKRQVLLMRTNYLLVLDELLERRRLCCTM